MKRNAYISSCKKYRYWLHRSWDEKKKSCSFIMLNPSTADDKVDDPTIRRCIGYAQKFGFGSMYVINLFAYRTPYKNVLKKASNPVGPENDKFIENIAKKSEAVIAAWGNEGRYILFALVLISLVIFGVASAPLVIPLYIIASLISGLF